MVVTIILCPGIKVSNVAIWTIIDVETILDRNMDVNRQNKNKNMDVNGQE